eukprot:6309876-Lingulodinium_polyedra.AAC.1
MPADHKLEPRPREPQTFDRWRRQAEQEIVVFEKVYGLEHGEERRKCLEVLVASHEDNRHKFPIEHL